MNLENLSTEERIKILMQLAEIYDGSTPLWYIIADLKCIRDTRFREEPKTWAEAELERQEERGVR